MIYFFFSSRRRHTRCSRDWSSDVCSSDLKRTAPRSPSPRVCPRAKSSRWRAQCGVTSVRGPDNYDADQLPCGGLPARVAPPDGRRSLADLQDRSLLCPVKRSEEHTSELQSRLQLGSRLLL